MKRFTQGLFVLLCALQLVSAAIGQVQPRPPGSSQITGVSGNGHVLATVNGPLTQGDGVVPDANGNLVDTGSPAGTGSGSGSARVIYTSRIPGITGGVAVVPGSSSTGDPDSYAFIQAAISAGSVDLEVDSGYALSAHLAPASNTTIHCIAPQFGFIMLPASNDSVIINAHTNAPTTANSTGGFLVSNIGDTGITVRGCTLNANSTQAVTGTNVLGTAHSATPGGSPKFVGGVEFYAVNGLTFQNNEVYDSGNWAVFGANDEYVNLDENYLHQPLPIVASKYTGGYQFDGPDQYIEAHGNKLNCGDDCIGFNADDGNITGSGDPNSPYVKSFVKWGNETDIQVSQETFVNAYYGVRLLSTNDLIDRVQFTDISGPLCGNTATLIAAYPSVGPGNLGTIRFNGWNVPTSGTCNTFGLAYNFNVSSNIQSLQLSGVQLTNPGVNWPVITQTAGNIGILSLRGWDLDTQTSGFSNVVSTTGGSIGQISASGISWYDNPSNTSAFFSGSAVPSTLTVSNYSGPNRLLASGYVPSIENGDAFTGTYATTYINTAFNEAASATALVGTAPATCINGCTGNWTSTTGYPSSNAWQYGTGGVLGAGLCASGSHCPAIINVGHSNYTARFQYASTNGATDSIAVVLRWTNASNFVFVGCVASQFQIIDVVAGSNTTEATGGTCTAGSYTITLNGTTVTMATPGGNLSGTISGSNTANNFGFENYGSLATLRITLASLSVKSN